MDGRKNDKKHSLLFSVHLRWTQSDDTTKMVNKTEKIALTLQSPFQVPFYVAGPAHYKFYKIE